MTFRIQPILTFLVFFPFFLNAQVITRFAGDGTGIAGFAGDGGPATLASMYIPYGICMNRAQEIFIADKGNYRIRKVAGTRIISTAAGTGVAGSGGDGGPATAAQFISLYGLASDSTESVYACDYVGMRIRKFIAGSGIATVIGNGTAGYSGDGGPATAAAIYSPTGITIDKRQNIYFGDRGNYRIRKVDPSGTITTVAGDGTSGFFGDGGPATAAKLNFPNLMVTDPDGNLYFTDAANNRVRKIDTFGIITTIAGNGTSGYSGDGLPATVAALNWPEGIVIDGCGNIFFDDGYNYRIRKINTAGIISTVAGMGSTGFSGDGGSPTAAHISLAIGMAVDKFGDLYISGDIGNYVRKISLLNHPPAFTGGHSQSCIVCTDSVRNIDTLLGVTDPDAAKTLTWNALTLPMHGTLVANYSTMSTGSPMLTTGLYYSPSAGYSGPDSFRVRVGDCVNLFDTTTVHVSVLPCGVALNILPASLADISLEIYPNPASVFIELKSAQKIERVVVSNLVGEVVYDNEFDTQHAQIDLSNLRSGLYVVKVNGRIFRRFIKE